jgi:hypothetical protein
MTQDGITKKREVQMVTRNEGIINFLHIIFDDWTVFRKL